MVISESQRQRTYKTPIPKREPTTPHKKNNHPEKAFERDLTYCAPLFKCLYTKIPDEIMTKKKVEETGDGKRVMAHPRPCDGVLTCRHGNYMIECKANTNTLSDKQTDYIEKVYKITSGMAYVLRVTTEIKRQIAKKIIIDKLKRHIYTIEYPEHKVLYETNQIENIFRWFNTKGDTNEMSQHN